MKSARPESVNFADQSPFEIRCEWGGPALEYLRAAEIVVIVDILPFSTCVEIAASRGALIFPYRWKDETATDFARKKEAESVGTRDRFSGRHSLAPPSLLKVEQGLRLVLPSPNGSSLSLRAKENGATVVAGCLRNAAAVGAGLQSQRKNVTVIPAGERWPDGSLRPAMEDLIGAGAIISHLESTLSPEARLAVATFHEFRDNLPEALRQSSSGRELVERGFPLDVKLAAELNISNVVPLLRGDHFQSEPAIGMLEGNQ